MFVCLFVENVDDSVTGQASICEFANCIAQLFPHFKPLPAAVSASHHWGLVRHPVHLRYCYTVHWARVHILGSSPLCYGFNGAGVMVLSMVYIAACEVRRLQVPMRILMPVSYFITGSTGLVAGCAGAAQRELSHGRLRQYQYFATRGCLGASSMPSPGGWLVAAQPPGQHAHFVIGS